MHHIMYSDPFVTSFLRMTRREAFLRMTIKNLKSWTLIGTNIGTGRLKLMENKERGKVINSTKYELDLTNKIKTELSKGKKVKIKIV